MLLTAALRSEGLDIESDVSNAACIMDERVYTTSQKQESQQCFLPDISYFPGMLVVVHIRPRHSALDS